MKKLIFSLALLISFQKISAMQEEMKTSAMDEVIKMPGEKDLKKRFKSVRMIHLAEQILFQN